MTTKFSQVSDKFMDLVVHQDNTTGKWYGRGAKGSHHFFPNNTGSTSVIGWDIPATELPATLDIGIIDNDFTYAAVLYIGGYRLVSGVDWVVGGTATLSAVALAATISRLKGFRATSLAEVVSIFGPNGGAGFSIPFSFAYDGLVINFSTVNDLYMTPPVITEAIFVP